jgi:diguanylate cyclase (GGDEF)-like protein
MAVMVIDLDGFKKINDECGHQFGDEVLRQVAQRLELHVRQLDTVARLGGDEFVIVLHQVANTRDIEALAGRIIERIGDSVEFASRSARVHASIGIALYPDHAEGIAGLMHAADLAMYAAKAAGKATFRMADPARKDRARQGITPP